jgi:hypothetical protein
MLIAPPLHLQVSDFAEIEAHLATTVVSAIQHVFIPDILFPAVQADKVSRYR